MLLTIDIGNTESTIGLFQDKTLVKIWRKESKKYSVSEWVAYFQYCMGRANLDVKSIHDIAISNVVPSTEPILNEVSQELIQKPPFLVHAKCKLGFIIDLDEPGAVGADLIANAAAAHDKYKSDLIIIDMGTATTFQVMTSDARYLGGMITPGLMISAEALFRMAEKLKPTEIQKPVSVIGKNTRDAIQSGLYYGYIGLIDSTIDRINEDTKRKNTVLLTGGLSHVIVNDLKVKVHHEPDLTLHGIRMIYKLNSETGR